ncbi:hypothetical protein [Amycolatopsis dongchuanensis]|uniref:Uncharacterized protein n=1 Tax=Amycolatopsis dongchuanensis TaxID=1070866 RepID=A0ABP8VF24_9PSEU
MSERSWEPAERLVPELLHELMHMGTVEYGGQVIQQYKHVDTRRYINLDGTGQAWEVAVAGPGEVGARRIGLDVAKARVLS